MRSAAAASRHRRQDTLGDARPLSNGRLRLGLGHAWSLDEHVVAGTAWENRAPHLVQLLAPAKSSP